MMGHYGNSWGGGDNNRNQDSWGGNHRNSYEKTGTPFINPYNFVSLPKEVKRSKYEEGPLTGYIELSMKTLTPLFIPNTSNDRYFPSEDPDHKSFDFYSYANLKGRSYIEMNFAPVIPGSEIRGCLRTIHEIQNDSCLSLVDRERGFSKRESAPQKGRTALFQPYFLFYEDGEYALYEAEKVKDRDFKVQSAKENCKFYDEAGDIVLDEELTAERVQKDNFKYFRCGERNPKGVSSKVFYKIKNSKKHPLTEKCIDLFKQTLAEYADPKINKTKDHTGYKDLRRAFENKEPVVVFGHGCGEGQWKLSPSCIGKYMCPNNLGDFVKDVPACSDLDDSCLTCQLFGFVDESSKTTHSSRLRFLDATTRLDPRYCYEDPITLKELLTPHPSNPIFYGYNEADNNEPATWNWDEKTGIKLRGRKVYLHSCYDPSSCKGRESRFTSTIHPVKSNVTFKSRIYFEGLNETQLESLIKAINLYNTSPNETKYAHKLGYAKPFGFGSVRMNVDSVVLRKISFDEGKVSYREDESDIRKDYSKDASPSDIELKNATNTRFINDRTRVCYPFAEGAEEGFEWFMNNKRADANAQQSLPKLSSTNEDQPASELKLSSNVCKKW